MIYPLISIIGAQAQTLVLPVLFGLLVMQNQISFSSLGASPHILIECINKSVTLKPQTPNK